MLQVNKAEETEKIEETNNQKVKSNKSEGEKQTNINPPERTLVKQLITSYFLDLNVCSVYTAKISG